MKKICHNSFIAFIFFYVGDAIKTYLKGDPVKYFIQPTTGKGEIVSEHPTK